MTEPKTWRGALIGCGYFAQNHLYAWGELPGAEIVAVCDLDAERARETARRHSVPAFYTNVNELLQAEKLDFVDIATQVSTHLPLIRQTAGQVPHLICQKPFALNLAGAQEMVQLCQQTQTSLTIHENFRFQSALRRAAELSSKLGKLFFGRIHFRSGYDVYANQPYLASDERFIIMDLGVHLFDLARFYFGEMHSITCHTQRVNPDIRGEDVATALLVSQHQATCVVELSYASAPAQEYFPQTLLELEGELGSLRVDGDYHITLVQKNPAGKPIVTREEMPPQLRSWSSSPGENVQDSVFEFQKHVLTSWQKGQQAETSGADNLRTLELTFAAYRSAELGQTVYLPYPHQYVV